MKAKVIYICTSGMTLTTGVMPLDKAQAIYNGLKAKNTGIVILQHID